MIDPAIEPGVTEPFVDWRAIVGGAVVASGVSFTLLAFGSAIGLSIVSTSPTWRDSTPWLWLLSGIFLIFVALCSFGFGGYVAGRMRVRSRLVAGPESEFRDGMHGAITWGLAVILGAVLTLGGVAAAAHAAAPSGGSAGPAASVLGENVIATELDEMFRSTGNGADTNIAYRRAEAARILLKSSGHNGIPGGDRKYLAEIMSSRTGLSETEAANRVGIIITQAQDDIHRARMAAVMQAFLVAAALMIGIAVSWFSAKQGGLDRELGAFPIAFRRRTPVRTARLQ